MCGAESCQRLQSLHQPSAAAVEERGMDLYFKQNDDEEFVPLEGNTQILLSKQVTG